MYSLDERKALMQIADFEKEINQVYAELSHYYNVEMATGVEAQATPTAKEKALIERVIKAVMKTEGIVTAGMTDLNKQANMIIQKLNHFHGVKVDDKSFSEIIAHSCPYADTFVRRPYMYALMQNMFSSVSTIMRDPATREDVLGESLKRIIDSVEAGGFKFTGSGMVNENFIHINMFEYTDRGRPQAGKTLKELGFTPEIVLKVCSEMTSNKRPNFFRTWWLSFRAQFYSFRFLWDLIWGRDEDDINRIDGINIRARRIAIIKSLSLYTYWLQHKRDFKTCDRLIGYLSRSSSYGGEALLNLDEVDPHSIIVNDTVVDSNDVIVDTSDSVVQPGYEDDLDEQETQIAQMIESFNAKLNCDYPSDQMFESTKKSIMQSQLSHNRSSAKKVIDLYTKTEEKNKRMLETFDKLLIQLQRYKKKVSTVMNASKLEEITVPNIPRYSTLNSHMMAYNELALRIKNSISSIKEPVQFAGDLGVKLNGMLGICEFIDFSIQGDKGLEGCSSRPIFDIRQYDKNTMNLREAGYTVMDLHQYCIGLETIRKNLGSAGAVYDGYDSIEDGELLELMSQIDYTDTVCLLEAGKTRRLRYSLLTHLRSQILLDSAVQDTAILLRIMKKIADTTN